MYEYSGSKLNILFNVISYKTHDIVNVHSIIKVTIYVFDLHDFPGPVSLPPPGHWILV